MTSAWLSCRARRTLAASFRRDRPALVYLVNGLTSNLDGVIAAALCGVPIICHEKGFRRVGPVERIMSRWVDRAICRTDDIAAHYRARGVRAHQFLTIPDGIDPSRFTTGGGDRVRDEVGIPREVVADGETGLLVPPRDPAGAVETVMTDVLDGRRTTMVEAA